MSDNIQSVHSGLMIYTDYNTNMATESSYVHQEFQDMPMQYQEIQDILLSSFEAIPVSCLEKLYKKKFKRSMDYDSIGVSTIEELLDDMCDKGMVLKYKHSKTKESCVTYARFRTKSSEIPDMPTTESSDIQHRPMNVYDEIQYIATGYIRGATMSEIEERYHLQFGTSPDYDSVGVTGIKELIGKMEGNGRVLVYQEPESKETYVMCALRAENLRKFLKQNVQTLLDEHGGKIPHSRFEAKYENEFKLKLNYNQYNLKDLDHLCQVLNLVVVEEADFPGEKVIKAGEIYNLRKRKIYG